MDRDIDIKEISDGRLYGLNDMVRADCQDCKGCFACCRGMGASIVLDPLDVHRLKQSQQTGFQGLLADRIELNVVEGIILPNLKMAGPQEACSFLDGQGRCSIHPYRPGICRIFPLGRLYGDGSFQYFLQVHECSKENKSKVKVKKWIDTPEAERNGRFISDWHYFLKGIQNGIRQDMLQGTADDETVKNISLYLLQTFYFRDFTPDGDFYAELADRLAEAKNRIDKLQ